MTSVGIAMLDNWVVGTYVKMINTTNFRINFSQIVFIYNWCSFQMKETDNIDEKSCIGEYKKKCW